MRILHFHIHSGLGNKSLTGLGGGLENLIQAHDFPFSGEQP
jgi:hypothetical protein